jgi:hypothetical protein
MSKIRVDIDTKEKTMKIVKDGEELTNVACIGCSNANEYADFYCYIQMKEKEEGGMYKHTSLTAEQVFAMINNYQKELEANR